MYLLWKDIINFKWLSKQIWYKDIIDYITTKDNICPKKENVFKMFKLLNPSDIRVVWIFNEPYTQLSKGEPIANGIGLAAPFETTQIKNMSKATQIIGKFDHTLMYLISQGVFSFNKYFTVESYKPGSCTEYNCTINDRPLRWDLYTEYILKQMNKHLQNIVYVFFGYEANKLSYLVNSTNNLIINTSHPSNRGYKYGLLDSNLFQKTNEYLKNNNKLTIKWKKDLN